MSSQQQQDIVESDRIDHEIQIMANAEKQPYYIIKPLIGQFQILEILLLQQKLKEKYSSNKRVSQQQIKEKYQLLKALQLYRYIAKGYWSHQKIQNLQTLTYFFAELNENPQKAIQMNRKSDENQKKIKQIKNRIQFIFKFFLVIFLITLGYQTNCEGNSSLLLFEGTACMVCMLIYGFLYAYERKIKARQ